MGWVLSSAGEMLWAPPLVLTLGWLGIEAQRSQLQVAWVDHPRSGGRWARGISPEQAPLEDLCQAMLC